MIPVNRRTGWWYIGLVAAMWISPACAIDGVVAPPNCNEAGFDNVLTIVDGSGGGTITFDCGSPQATITFTTYKQISAADVIDGAGLITFDGNNASAFFQVFNGANLTLRNLILTHGVFNGSHALENFGTLSIEGGQFVRNASTASAIANYGALTITQVLAEGNSISGGANPSGGLLLNDGGNVFIGGSDLSGNSIVGPGTGGAIANISGDLIVYGGYFYYNSAFDGGAIFIDTGATATIRGSLFQFNAASAGGAIESFGTQLTVTDATFDSNAAQTGDGGAILLENSGLLSVDRSEFTNNQSTANGGAISCFGDAATITNSAFGNNQSGTNGGALYSDCMLTVNNATFSANAATGGGTIYQGGIRSATVSFATIAANTAQFGAGVYNETGGMSALTISDSILSANTAGNCDGLIRSGGYNLADDDACISAFTQTGDVLNANLPLAAFGNYGGATSTQPPLAGNQALDHIPAVSCASPYDQRGAVRPTGAGCDSGAVELDGIIDAVFVDGFDPP